MRDKRLPAQADIAEQAPHALADELLAAIEDTLGSINHYASFGDDDCMALECCRYELAELSRKLDAIS